MRLWIVLAMSAVAAFEVVVIDQSPSAMKRSQPKFDRSSMCESGGPACPFDSPTDPTSPSPEPTQTPDEACSGVNVSPTSDLQALINLNPTGTTFCLGSGTYSIGTTLFPKANDKFIAVASRQAILTGNDQTSMSFNGQGVSGVTIQGLQIVHFNTPAQGGLGALKASSGWKIIDNEIAYNATLGLYHESGALISGNYIHHNKTQGIGGWIAANSVITGNEVSFNGPGDGGSKWVGSTNLVITNNYFHDNLGNEIWLDTDNSGLIDANTVVATYQYGKAISLEQNTAAITVSNNAITVASSGEVAIMVNNSSNDKITGNTLTVSSTGGYGIHLFYDSTRTGYDTANNVVTDNTVTLQGGATYASGVSCYLVSDCKPYWTTKGNSFQGDDYTVPNLSAKNWVPGSASTWSLWQGAGLDTTGTVKQG